MQNNTETTDPTARPLGYWLRTVDGLLAREFAAAFDAEGITRRDWRILNLLGGDVIAPELADRLQRHGGKKLNGLIQRGWVVESNGEFTLTDDGREAKDRLGGIVAGIRTRVAGAVPEADFATMMTSLQAIATELGWDPDERMPRGPRHPGFGRGRGRDCGPGFGAGFGDGTAPDFGHSFGPGRHHGEPCGGHGHGGRAGARRADDAGTHRQRGHGRGHRHAEGAFERGFTAGFERGSAPREA